MPYDKNGEYTPDAAEEKSIEAAEAMRQAVKRLGPRMARMYVLQGAQQALVATESAIDEAYTGILGWKMEIYTASYLQAMAMGVIGGLDRGRMVWSGLTHVADGSYDAEAQAAMVGVRAQLGPEWPDGVVKAVELLKEKPDMDEAALAATWLYAMHASLAFATRFILDTGMPAPSPASVREP